MSEDTKWEEAAQQEIMGLGQVLFANFKHVINLAMEHCPDQLNVENRAKIFEMVIRGWLGAAMIPVATYGNTTKEIENLVVSEIRMKFEWMRENEKDLQLQRLEKVSEERKTRTGLVIVPGTNDKPH